MNWDEVLSLEGRNIDTTFDSFNSTVNKLVDRHLPTVTLTHRKSKLKRQKPWITTGILKSISKRDFYFRKFLKAKSDSCKSKFHNLFKLYRNQIISLCRRSKSNHFTRYFNSYSQNAKKIWIGIKQIISLKPPKSSDIISLKIGNSVTSDPASVANEFNSFFTSIADTIRTKIPPEAKHFSKYLNTPNLYSIFLSPVTPAEVSKVISSLSCHKSTGPNSIPTKILKSFNLDFSEPIAEIANLSFSSGQFPAALKVSKVVPVFKKGSSLETSNYRPISLLSNIDKILELLMCSRLTCFLDRHRIIYNRQFGFRNSHSTSQALIDIVERIRQCLDSGQAVVGVFVDIQKAFDTVDNEILCSKLYHYGIRGKT